MSTWMVGLGMGFLLTLVVEPNLRNYFKRIKVEQLVMRTNGRGPDHAAKAGTPTMGGAGFIPVVLIGYLIIGGLTHHYAATAFATLIGIFLYAIVGGLDDSVKIFNQRDEGFRFLPKLTVEILAAILGALVLWFGHFDFVLPLPLGLPAVHSVLVYTLFTIFWLVGWSNATNLTDGLDGLAAGAAIIAYSAYLILALQVGDSAMALVDALMVGALLAFMIFNRHPASIFMGDTGSLALGAGLAMNSLVLHQPWSLLLIGLVFMLDTLSVLIQVPVYYFTGKRVFLMTPIHHSFEKGGLTGNVEHPWSEWRVDGFFWGLGLLGALLYFIFF
ncbi:phospho-N-acetylmuramoyl-pentapeptide-transferase [Weissella halotolerans]|uniref:Phospho-N-acetylmuramoyl-pentapeptide-transferase n=1 Tax=Weissella halotolerans DSM 20190 TaxID=1123500 RepID=A0A0R2G315_9LACO|nr:phospho-N-acetylmuramoyl-pentapeptide-transferase [Weissella halotolerans]KRN31756.1 phospho-N-acetylmuramoyl-pentapeptide-transferase [Weissella halotolerans DSM 20190]